MKSFLPMSSPRPAFSLAPPLPLLTAALAEPSPFSVTFDGLSCLFALGRGVANGVESPGPTADVAEAGTTWLAILRV